MIVNCKNISNLPYANQLKLLSGASGLNRVIEGIHVFEEPKWIEFIRENYLVITVGFVLKNNSRSWINYIESLYSHNAAALVIAVGGIIKEVPKELINLCEDYGFPIYELPINIRISDVSQSIYYSIFRANNMRNISEKFFLNLLYSNSKINTHKLQTAISFGYNTRSTYYCMVLEVTPVYNTKQEASGNLQAFEYEYEDIYEDNFLKDTENDIYSFMYRQNINILLASQNESLILLIPMERNNNIKLLTHELYEHIKLNNQVHKMCVGYPCKDIKAIKNSFEKIQYLLDTTPFPENYPIVYYTDLDIEALFYDVKDIKTLENLLEHSIGALISYKKNKDMNLLITLRTYIDQNCNIIKTASLLFIHINTLRYRLKKIECILGCDLRESKVVFNIRVALYIKDYLDKLTVKQEE